MSLADLFSGDETRAQNALAGLTPADEPALVAALDAEDPDTRWWAAVALGHLPSPASTQALIAHSLDADATVRAGVLLALGQHRAEAAVRPLIFALGTAEAYLSRVAADALIHIGPPAVPALIETLDHDVTPLVRGQAARALALLADPRAIPALFRALDDESPVVSHWAELGLEKMGVGQVYFKPG